MGVTVQTVKDYSTLPPIVSEVREFRGNPNNVLKARPGTYVWDSVNFVMYIKASTEDLASGWKSVDTTAA